MGLRSRLQESRVTQDGRLAVLRKRCAPVPADCLSITDAPLLNARKSKVGALTLFEWSSSAIAIRLVRPQRGQATKKARLLLVRAHCIVMVRR